MFKSCYVGKKTYSNSIDIAKVWYLLYVHFVKFRYWKTSGRTIKKAFKKMIKEIKHSKQNDNKLKIMYQNKCIRKTLFKKMQAEFRLQSNDKREVDAFVKFN